MKKNGEDTEKPNKGKQDGTPRSRLKKTDDRVRMIAYAGIFTAAIAIISAYVKVPVMNGYVHMGDGLILFAATMLGPVAAIPAVLGSVISDLINGCPQYILPTVIIKAVMGLAEGFFALKTARLGKKKWIWMLLVLIGSEIIMVFGYHVAEDILYGSAAAMAGLLGNICQGIMGVIVGMLFLPVSSYLRTGMKDRKQYDDLK